MSEKRTDIKELGEFGLIDRITSAFKLNQPSSVLGVGDDAALVDNTGRQTVLTTDMLLEGIHFDLSYMPLKHLGFKAVAANISDLAAMNATPGQILVNIGLSNRFSLEATEELYKGIEGACQAYQVDLIGGDTTSSRQGLVISITAIGSVSPDQVVKRSGARPNDILCVTGDLGAAYLGLQVLEREKQVFMADPNMQPKIDDYQYVVQRQLRPEARMDIIHELRELNLIPTSMIDISDGLASELFHLSKHSGTGFRVFEDKLPVDKETYDTAYEFKLDPTTCALNGGEDYELLFTISQEDFEKVKDHRDIHFIGQVTDQQGVIDMVTKGDNIVPLQAQGWNHMRDED